MGPLAEDERIAWDMYFSGLVAFQLHPGNHMDPKVIDIGPYAELADRMILERRRRFAWPGDMQQ